LGFLLDRSLVVGFVMSGGRLRLHGRVHHSNEPVDAFNQAGSEAVAIHFGYLPFEALERVRIKSLGYYELCESLVVDSEMILQLANRLVHEPNALEFEKVIHLRW
jgi:hypothetical protein